MCIITPKVTVATSKSAVRVLVVWLDEDLPCGDEARGCCSAVLPETGGLERRRRSFGDVHEPLEGLAGVRGGFYPSYSLAYPVMKCRTTSELWSSLPLENIVEYSRPPLNRPTISQPATLLRELLAALKCGVNSR
jgi:hypothetical protein